MARGRFLLGVVVGVLGAYAAKKIYDNKDEVSQVLKEKTDIAREEVIHFVDFASDKVSQVKEEVTQKTAAFADMAKDQLNEIKDAIETEDEGEVTLEFDEE